MALIAQPSRIPSGGVFEVLGAEYDSAQTFPRGAFLIPDGSNPGKYAVAGVNSPIIAGVALQGANTAPGFQMANSPDPITGREYKVSMAVANNQTQFESTLTDGSSTRVTPATTDIGQQYGYTVYNGVVTIDRAKTGANARVLITAIITANNREMVVWKFLPSVLPGS